MLSSAGYIVNGVALLCLVIASITDVKTREVPDWLNYGLISLGLLFNAAYSVIIGSWMPILFSIAGAVLLAGLALAMFYTGQWGGGDSKLIIGLGALLGLPLSRTPPFISINNPPMLVNFLMNLVIAGTAYSLVWCVVLAVKNRRRFTQELKRNLARLKKVKLAIIAVSVVMLAGFAFSESLELRLILLSAIIVMLSTFYLWVFVRSIERSSMLKLVEPERLTEGDWIARDVIVGKKRICGPSDLGISREQIRELIRLKQRGRVKKVLVKEGVPFVPSFLLSFIMSLSMGNIMLNLVMGALQLS